MIGYLIGVGVIGTFSALVINTRIGLEADDGDPNRWVHFLISGLLTGMLITELKCMLWIQKTCERRGARKEESSERYRSCLLAQTRFDKLGTARLQFRRVHLEEGQLTIDWAAAKPEAWRAASIGSSSQKTCICCLEDFQPDTQVCVLPCGHAFHDDCIARWLVSPTGCAGSCPTCRAPTTDLGSEP
ncbi:Rnf103 [Symbiodinium sp. CCMP2592]|nr:Rnf103 [Symbiodinium sp. CCMP2592]